MDGGHLANRRTPERPTRGHLTGASVERPRPRSLEVVAGPQRSGGSHRTCAIRPGKTFNRGRNIGLDLGALPLKSLIAGWLQGPRPASSGNVRGGQVWTYRHRHRGGSSRRARHQRSCTNNAAGRRTCLNHLGGSGPTLSSRPCTGRASCRTSRSSPSTRSTSRRRTCGPSTWTTRPCAPPRSTTSWATSTRGPSSSHPHYLPHMSPCNRTWEPYLRCRATKMVMSLMGHIVYGILAPATTLRLHRLAPVMPLT